MGSGGGEVERQPGRESLGLATLETRAERAKGNLADAEALYATAKRASETASETETAA